MKKIIVVVAVMFSVLMGTDILQKKLETSDLNKTKLKQSFPNFINLDTPIWVGFVTKLNQEKNITTLLSGEPYSGTITIENRTSIDKSSTIKTYFIKDNVVQKSTIRYASCSIPAFKINTYKLKNAPSIKVNKKTMVYFVMENKKGKVKIPILVLPRIDNN